MFFSNGTELLLGFSWCVTVTVPPTAILEKKRNFSDLFGTRIVFFWFSSQLLFISRCSINYSTRFDWFWLRRSGCGIFFYKKKQNISSPLFFCFDFPQTTTRVFSMISLLLAAWFIWSRSFYLIFFLLAVPRCSTTWVDISVSVSRRFSAAERRFIFVRRHFSFRLVEGQKKKD